MNRKLKEKELAFEFVGIISATKLDEPGLTLPSGMSFVDFVVEESTRCLLIEVKDPSHSRAPQSERTRFVEQMNKGELINAHLVPKCRDSYTFLHLMNRDSKPFLYIVVLGLQLDEAQLLPFKDRLLSRLRKETDYPWERQYITDCQVLTLASWPSSFPNYSLKRETN